MKTMVRVSNMGTTLLILCLLSVSSVSFAQMHPVAKESNIHFSLKNFGFRTGGTFGAPEGNISFNPADLPQSSFQVTVQSESINTDNDSRDEHLREPDYFDVKNYPLIRFVSSSIRSAGNGKYVAVGTLTIKNKSKEIQLPFTAEKKGDDWLFNGSFSMNRRDFNVGGSSTLSNELTVTVIVLAR